MMRILEYFLFLLLSTSLSFSCEDSLLIVGGEDASGPLTSLHLLTPTGWCQDINIPPMPEPVENPAVHFFSPDNTVRNILIVCGFTSEPCMWSESGADTWHSLPLQEISGVFSKEDYVSNQTFKILSLDRQSLILVSTKAGDNYVGHTHTTRLDWFPNPWLPADDQTAEFSLTEWGGTSWPFTKNLTGSCLARLGQELLLSGGRTSEMPLDSSSQVRTSDSSVGRMSPGGPIHCEDPECGPMWESGVVPDLGQGRDEHRCLTTVVEDKEVIMVGGGSMYDYIWGKSGVSYYTERETYQTLRSVEVYDGSEWTQAGEFQEARAGFGLAELCGEVVALGGRQCDGTYMWERVYNGPPDCGDACWEETVTDTITQTLLDTVEVLRSGTWGLHHIKLPQPMTNFGLVTVPTSLCNI